MVSEKNTILVVKKLKVIIIPMPNGELWDIERCMNYATEWWKTYIETGVSPVFDEVKDKE